jgi:hypothetical protein
MEVSISTVTNGSRGRAQYLAGAVHVADEPREGPVAIAPASSVAISVPASGPGAEPGLAPLLVSGRRAPPAG